MRKNFAPLLYVLKHFLRIYGTDMLTTTGVFPFAASWKESFSSRKSGQAENCLEIDLQEPTSLFILLANRHSTRPTDENVTKLT